MMCLLCLILHQLRLPALAYSPLNCQQEEWRHLNLPQLQQLFPFSSSKAVLLPFMASQWHLQIPQVWKFHVSSQNPLLETNPSQHTINNVYIMSSQEKNDAFLFCSEENPEKSIPRGYKFSPVEWESEWKNPIRGYGLGEGSEQEGPWTTLTLFFFTGSTWSDDDCDKSSSLIIFYLKLISSLARWCNSW